MASEFDLRQLILELTRRRGPEKSICPAEVARAADPESWRALMPAVRHLAEELAAAGQIVILQQGRPVPAGQIRGPIRLRVVADS